jgi:hypothetical protein
MMDELLTSSVVTRTVEEHVLDSVDWDRGGCVDRRGAGGVSAEWVDGVSTGLVEAG